jgi:hypothetical protein
MKFILATHNIHEKSDAPNLVNKSTSCWRISDLPVIRMFHLTLIYSFSMYITSAVLFIVFITDVTVSSSHTHFYFPSLCFKCLTVWHLKEMCYYVYKNIITHLFGFPALILKIWWEVESKSCSLCFSTLNSVAATLTQVSNSVPYFQLPSAYFFPWESLSLPPPQTRWKNHSSKSCNQSDFRYQAGRLKMCTEW